MRVCVTTSVKAPAFMNSITTHSSLKDTHTGSAQVIFVRHSNSLLGEEYFLKVDEVLVRQLPHNLDFHQKMHLKQEIIIISRRLGPLCFKPIFDPPQTSAIKA